MRVTSSMMVRTTLRDLGNSYQRLATTQSHLSTGRAVIRPSDNPTAATDAMGYRHSIRRNDQYLRSIENASGWLQTADSRLLGIHDQLEHAKRLVVSGMNTGAHTAPEVRAAIATEIRTIRADLLATANGHFGDRPLFAGAAGGPAYGANGEYLGDMGSMQRDVAPATLVEINLRGPEVFGVHDPAPTAVGNLFQVLERIAAAVEAGDNATLSVEHGHLDTAMSRVRSVTAEIGARTVRLEGIKSRAQDDDLNLRSLLSQVEDVDLVDALISVQAQETAYQAALSTAAKVLPMSLLDFLR